MKKFAISLFLVLGLSIGLSFCGPVPSVTGQELLNLSRSEYPILEQRCTKEQRKWAGKSDWQAHCKLAVWKEIEQTGADGVIRKTREGCVLFDLDLILPHPASYKECEKRVERWMFKDAPEILKRVGWLGKDSVNIVSSWYGPGFHGRQAADGSIYDQRARTVAHRAWPFGIWLVLRNPANGRMTVAKVTDRGPYIDKRGLDVSERIAEELGFKQQGIATLEVYFF